MKLGTLNLIFEALNTMMESELPVRTSYTIVKALEPITRELNSLEAMRARLVEKHTKDGNTNKDKFLEDYNELMEMEVDVKVPTISMKEIMESGARITPLALSILISTGVLTED